MEDIMKRLLFILLTLVIAAGAFGCTPKATAGVIQSNKARDASPQVSPDTQAQLVEGNNAFAFDLYRSLAENGGNIFFSPYSISEALAMTYAGAKGQTESDMATALHFTLTQDKLHPSFNWLDLELANRGENAKGKDNEGFRLNVANALWGQQDYKFLSPFLDTLAINYGAGLRTVNFIKNTEQSRITINDWVAEQTEDRIKDLIPQGSLNDLTRLVLTNAIYFNAAWLNPFDTDKTETGIFYRLDGSAVSASIMKQVESMRYASGENYQAVELPYDGRELSMIILMPDEGTFTEFEKSLDSTAFQEILQQLRTHEVTLTVPKFQYESSFGLKDALSSLGMGIAFTDGADFSGMNGTNNLLIQDVLHKAFISVDEAGTEAAAATAVIVGLTAMPQPAEMTINRPFIYLIRDNATGSLIFVGRVLDPVAK
jgi:serpin B